MPHESISTDEFPVCFSKVDENVKRGEIEISLASLDRVPFCNVSMLAPTKVNTGGERTGSIQGCYCSVCTSNFLGRVYADSVVFSASCLHICVQSGWYGGGSCDGRACLTGRKAET